MKAVVFAQWRPQPKGIYVSNIITVPEKQQDTAEPQEASEAE